MKERTSTVTDVSRHGLWLLCRDRELFMSFKDFPWFKDAPVASLFHVEEPSPNHFYWPDLDVDLGLRTIEDPQRFPLVANGVNALLKQPMEVRDGRADARGGISREPRGETPNEHAHAATPAPRQTPHSHGCNSACRLDGVRSVSSTQPLDTGHTP